MKKIVKKIPHFKNEDDERTFWAKADSSEYFDLSAPKKVILSNLMPSTEKISLRLPVNLLSRIKTIANRSDIPYQSYMKLILSEKIQELSSPQIKNRTIHHRASTKVSKPKLQIRL
jgi:predicted DNA binding CopG/RHH family protein